MGVESMAKRVKYRGRIPSYQCLIWSVSSALVGDVLVQPDFLGSLSNGTKSLKMFHNKFFGVSNRLQMLVVGTAVES